MTGPRDDPRYVIPVDPISGDPLTPAQQARLASLRTAALQLRAVMHECIGEAFDPQGRNPDLDDRFGNRSMAVAATNLDTCLLWANRAALETK